VGGWMLLTGDLQKEGESRLLRRGLLKPVELLKAGHHGSRTSSTPAFLRALRPKAAVIQCGPHNRYRHPSAAALKSLQGVKLHRTDLNGCVAVEHDALGMRIKAWKEASESELRAAPPKVPPSPWKRLQKQGLLRPEGDAE
jgi:beta-lactamase superfamily II metal-dependent hydrolase